MSMLSRIALAGASVFVSGCAIHPLPEDFSGVPTNVIVKQIRCETRKAVIDLALGWLTNPENLANGRVDPRAHEIGLQFQAEQLPIQQLNPKLFTGHVRDIVGLFYDTG